MQEKCKVLSKQQLFIVDTEHKLDDGQSQGNTFYHQNNNKILEKQFPSITNKQCNQLTKQKKLLSQSLSQQELKSASTTSNKFYQQKQQQLKEDLTQDKITKVTSKTAYVGSRLQNKQQDKQFQTDKKLITNDFQPPQFFLSPSNNSQQKYQPVYQNTSYVSPPMGKQGSNLLSPHSQQPYNLLDSDSVVSGWWSNNNTQNQTNQSQTINTMQRSAILKKKRQEQLSFLQKQTLMQQHMKEIIHFFSLTQLFHEQLESRFTQQPSSGHSTLLDQYLVCESMAIKLINQFNSHFTDLFSQLNQALSTYEDACKKCKLIQDQNAMLIEQLNAATTLSGSSQKRLGKISNLTATLFNNQSEQQQQTQQNNNIIEYQQQTNSLNLENIKLSSTVQTLTKSLEKYEKELNVDGLLHKIEELESAKTQTNLQLEEKLDRRRNMLQVCGLAISNLKNWNLQLESDLQFYKNHYVTNNQVIEELRIQNSQYHIKMNNYRERMQMQMEDYIGLREKNNELKELISSMRLRMKKLQEKVDRELNFKSRYIEVPDNSDKLREENMFFVSLRAYYKTAPVFYRQIKLEYKGIRQDDVERRLRRDNEIKENLAKQQHLDTGGQSNNITTQSTTAQEESTLNNLSIYKPAFFGFIESKYNVMVKGNPEAMRQRQSKITFIFMGTVRGILDSKYNEFMLSDDTRQYSHFADFVFSWLGKFQIDKVTRQVNINSEAAANTFAADEVRINFYMDLMNPQLSKLWEIITFREFLVEDAAPDEVFFYLHSRNLLFKGPQLQYMNSTFEPIHYIRLDTAIRVAENLLSRFDKINVEFVLKVLHERAIRKKNGLQLLDSAFVLRILLEYYRAERLQRFRLIKELFYSQSGKEIEGRYCLNFDSFRKVFEGNFTYCSELEKAQIFRQCFSSGQGKVCAEVFFSVASDSFFFIKNLKVKMMHELPSYDFEINAFVPDGTDSKILADFVGLIEGANLQTKPLEEIKTVQSQINITSQTNIGVTQEPIQTNQQTANIQASNGVANSSGIGITGQSNKLISKQLLDISKSFGVERIYQDMNYQFWLANNKFLLTNADMQGKSLALFFKEAFVKWIYIINLKQFQDYKYINSIYDRQLMQSEINSVINIATVVLKQLESKQEQFEKVNLVKLKKFQKWVHKKISLWYNLLNQVLIGKLEDVLKKALMPQQN